MIRVCGLSSTWFVSIHDGLLVRCAVVVGVAMGGGEGWGGDGGVVVCGDVGGWVGRWSDALVGWWVGWLVE